MISREELMAKIERVPDERLEEVNRLLESFAKEEISDKSKTDRRTFFERLAEIEIDLPPDASQNIDLYLSGEKSFD
ncbi:MAG: hypothetical protein MSG64_13960 [Pyrinomonadaceae bacterium MAG19_C2-C3]|nr:hypothetical protein [Pyrinomonadaceae bacterium MAG19_C2-C3]